MTDINSKAPVLQKTSGGQASALDKAVKAAECGTIPLLLAFPGPGAVDISDALRSLPATEPICPPEPAPGTGPPRYTLVMIDGTWQFAKEMFKALAPELLPPNGPAIQVQLPILPAAVYSETAPPTQQLPSLAQAALLKATVHEASSAAAPALHVGGAMAAFDGRGTAAALCIAGAMPACTAETGSKSLMAVDTGQEAAESRTANGCTITARDERLWADCTQPLLLRTEPMVRFAHLCISASVNCC
jgi:hypothetical protein